MVKSRYMAGSTETRTIPTATATAARAEWLAAALWIVNGPSDAGPERDPAPDEAPAPTTVAQRARR